MPETNAPVLSIVLPVYREGAVVSEALLKINDAAASLKIPYELVVVDDGSTDNTWEYLETLSSQHPSLKVIGFSRNFGKEHAVCAGLEQALGQAVIVMDSDLQHPPELIPQMFALWKNEGWDIVEGVKTVRGKESVINKMGAWFFYKTMTALTGHHLENSSDFKLLDRKVVSVWQQMGERHLFFKGMIAWLGFRKTQLPFEVSARIGGNSKWSFLSLCKLMLTAITAFSPLPLQLVTLSGLVFLGFAMIMAAQTLYMKISGQAVDGFPTVILLILITGSFLMLGLGIIGEYLARIYDEVKQRPRYVISKRLN